MLRRELLKALASLPVLPSLPGLRPSLRQHGLASWYNEPRRTASGEMFNPHLFTAAHRHLPFGTHLLVRAGNGAGTVVRVNDRGPYVAGRIIDLSPSAARAIGLTKHNGLLPVTIDVLAHASV